MGMATTKPGWTLEPGAWLEVPVNAFYGTRGQRPEPAICRATDDPTHYKVYMDPEQADPEEWSDTGLIFGGTYSERDWREQMTTLPEGDAVPSTASDAELQAYEQAMRNIRGER